MTGHHPPAQDEVHIWTVDLARIPEPGAEHVLDSSERTRAARFRVAPARTRFERRRIGLRSVLSGYLACDPAEVRIERSCPHCGDPDHGKPRLSAGGLAFSSAASGDLAVVAVATSPIGIDIEDAAAIEGELSGGAPAGLWSDGERRLAASGREASLWVRKEALSKAIGTGLVAGEAELDTTRTAWQLYDLPDIGGRIVALAASRPVRRTHVRVLAT